MCHIRKWTFLWSHISSFGVTSPLTTSQHNCHRGFSKSLLKTRATGHPRWLSKRDAAGVGLGLHRLCEPGQSSLADFHTVGRDLRLLRRDVRHMPEADVGGLFRSCQPCPPVKLGAELACEEGMPSTPPDASIPPGSTSKPHQAHWWGMPKCPRYI